MEAPKGATEVTKAWLTTLIYVKL